MVNFINTEIDHPIFIFSVSGRTNSAVFYAKGFVKFHERWYNKKVSLNPIGDNHEKTKEEKE